MKSGMKIKVLEYVDGYAVLQLPAWDFEKLSLKDKLLIYYLWNASVAGDRIAYDQCYAYGPTLRDFFLDILEHKKAVKKDVYEKILLYAKNIVISHGNHDARSTIKFLPKFTLRELELAIDTISKKGFKHTLTDELKKVIFEQNLDIMLTQKNPKTGDIITESKNTFYKNISLKDLEGFTDRYPLNSTVVKEDEKIVEKVWRCGDSRTSQGMYASELYNIVKNLRMAQECSDESYRKILGLLIKYFETGDPKHFDGYNIEWLKNDPNVDTILGFIEQYLDARGFKGMYEGVVFFKDEKSSRIVRAIANASQYLEDNAPWPDRYKKKWNHIPVANAMVQVMATGGAGPVCFAGVNLPNAQWIREKYNSKNFYVSNVTYAGRMAFAELLWKEFVERPEDVRLLQDSFTARGPALVTLHEIVGHGSGKMNPRLKGDPRDYLLENYSTLEEARAELCALYHIFNEKLIKDGIVSVKDAKGAYLSYVIQYLTQLRRYENEDMIHEDHERATSIIVRYLLEKDACTFYMKRGKTYVKIVGYEMMRRHVGELLSEIMRIKAEGDYASGKALVERYGIYFDLKLRDEIVRRAKKINYPNNHAYVMYHPELIYSKSKEIVDVKMIPYKSILEQAKHWRELYG
jgi:dipeptidyl-peptidase-3